MAANQAEADESSTRLLYQLEFVQTVQKCNIMRYRSSVWVQSLIICSKKGAARSSVAIGVTCRGAHYHPRFTTNCELSPRLGR